MDIFEKIYCSGPEDCTEEELLRLLEDAAAAHSVQLGIDHDRIASQYGCTWMLSRSWYQVSARPRAGEPLRVQTWVSKLEGWGTWRAHQIGGVGRSLELWVLVDIASRKLVPLSRLPRLEGTELDAGWELPAKVPPLRTGAPLGSFTVEEPDLDVNGHMNNTRYVRHALALLREREDCPAFFPSLRITYSRECRLGEAIGLTMDLRPDGILLSGQGPDGKPRFGIFAQG